MKITRRFTKAGQDPLMTVSYEKRTSRITNPDGTVVFEMTDAEIPVTWSQLATDIMVSKYFRKAGVPQKDAAGQAMRDEKGQVVTGPERSVKQVVNRLAGCWRWWGESHGYFDTAEDAQAFYDELAYMLVHQMCAPNSPQWFNTGLNWAYGISGPSQGHFYCDPKTGELKKADDAYTHPQPHACFIQSVQDDLVNAGGIMDLWVREARLFKYGSGTGSNFSNLRGENERLSGGGKSSGLMSFLKIGDRAAGAIKSGGTTRRAAKMVCLNLDHPDIQEFVNWKVREELKVAAMAEGLKALPRDQKLLAERLKLKLDYDFNGEAYQTVSGQNSNNSVRIPNQFFHLVETDGEWELTNRCNKKVAKKIKARDLWEQIAFAAWRCADPGVQFDDTINQWHTCPQSGRINASNPCVTGDTRVLTPGGIWRRIDQMIHLPGRIVTNLDGQEIHGTEGSFPTGTREVFELRTEGGYTLKLTGDHKVWTRRRGWIQAKDLSTQDEVRLPSAAASFREIGEPADGMFYQLLGMFCSESNDDLENLNLDRCMLPEDQVDRYASYVEAQWGDHRYDDDYIDYAIIGDPGTQTTVATLTNLRLLCRLRSFVQGSGSRRHLSDAAFTSGLAAQKHMLRGLFSADGDVVDGSIEIRELSLALLKDVQTLLLGFGIRSAIGEGISIHTLRIDEGSLQAFTRDIGLLPGDMRAHLEAAACMTRAVAPGAGHWERVIETMSIGEQQVFDLREPVTSSFIANGITVHNCSEYMFLDDTACNLASFNILQFFDTNNCTFDTDAYRHAIRLWTIVLEISVLMASFPSEEIAQLSYEFRTLGLGYANLGAMLMQAGIPYNSEKGRAICASLTSILTGEAYATSAEMAKELGAFAGYAKNKNEMLRVIRNHRRAAYDVTGTDAASKKLGGYESLEIKPVGIDAKQFAGKDSLASASLLKSAQECWDRAVALGEKHGYRNAQTTVIAPTGTIGLLMDCDTTGVEPDFALVKFKKLAGGGYFKIANQSLKPALVNLGYSPEQITAIMNYVMGTLSLAKTPHINRDTLKAAGLTEQEITKAEDALPGTFELSFAFTPWTLGEDAMKRLKIAESDWKSPGFSMLRKLGFTPKQIAEANEVVCGTGTVEGAPHLKVEDYSVFECANRCGRKGRLFIPVEGHIRMMAAAQPFISGAISKTINLPNEATVEDIKESYQLSWKLGLKANALYRDGSKLSQPLNVKSDDDLDKSEEDDEENVAAAKEELAGDVAKAVTRIEAVARQGGKMEEKELKSDNLAPAHSNVVEKIVERIVERPLRKRLPDTRNAITHKFDVAGHEGYITVGLYDDGMPGEVFITMAKEGSTIGGLMDTIATLVSVSLQYGVPVESLVRKFEHVRYEPSGMTRNPEIPFAKSLTDYIFRWLAMEFIPGYRAQYAPKRGKGTGESKSSDSEGAPSNGGNGHGSGVKPGSASFAYTEAEMRHAAKTPGGRLIGVVSGDLKLAPIPDVLSQQGSQMQADAPACDVCGSITVRSGTCYKCLNCGNSMGCS